MKKDKEKKEVSFNEDNHVDVKNTFIKAQYPEGMKAIDHKVLRFVISQCQKGDKKFFEYEFSAMDLAKFLNTDRFNLYREADEMTKKRLFNCNLEIKDRNKSGKGKLIHLFGECDYDNGTFTMQLDSKASELFLDLQANFTEIPIAPILLMKNKNSIRIYELICQRFMSHYPYADHATSINVTLDELREITETKDKKSYDHTGHFKNKILNPSITEIEACAEWKIIVTNLKRSKQVVGYNLEVWSQYGYEQVEKSKRTGELLPGRKPDDDKNQMTLWDLGMEREP